MQRQIFLDTETTGLEVGQEHRIIEIGCVELVNRRPTANDFHHYVNPERAIDPGALAVHGITNEALAEKPRFVEIAHALLDYVRGAEVLIHNAEFDTGFINAELARAGIAERIENVCTIVDTVAFARRVHPGQKNSLDALCKRYGVDNSQRDLHGALLDARLLADVYVAMTTGQSALLLAAVEPAMEITVAVGAEAETASSRPLAVIRASVEELVAHQARLAAIAKKAGRVLWASDLSQPEAHHA